MIVTRLACAVTCAAWFAGCGWIAGLKSHGIASNDGSTDTPQDTPTGAPDAPLAFPYTGYYTGGSSSTVALEPTLSWTASAGASSYKLRLGPTSDLSAAPTLALGSAMSYTPSSPLVMSSMPPVGARWYWSVAACNAIDCTWTATRYLNVGRLPDDLDGNGRSDLVVGSGIGEVWAFLDVATSGSGASYSVTSYGTNFGRVLNTGDFNGDGFADVATYADGSGNAGVIVVAPGGDFSAPTGFGRPTPIASEQFGSVAISPGDLDGDGYDDLVVIEPRQITEIPGSSNGLTAMTLHAIPALTGTLFQAGAALGDVDGDGYPDFAVSTDGGEIAVYYGGPFDQQRDPSLIAAPASVTAWGQPITGGDLDGDGFADIIVSGVDSNTGNGLIYVIAGGAAGSASPVQAFTIAQPDPAYGRSLMYERDVQSGGYLVAIGGTGQGWVFTGPQATAIPLTDNGTHAPSYSGTLGGGDFIGDGRAHVIAGSTDDPTTAPSCGLAQAFELISPASIHAENTFSPTPCTQGEAFSLALTR